jgi:hypothetical protein
MQLLLLLLQLLLLVLLSTSFFRCQNRCGPGTPRSGLGITARLTIQNTIVGRNALGTLLARAMVRVYAASTIALVHRLRRRAHPG